MPVVTQARLDELKTTFSTAFFAAYNGTPTVFQDLTVQIPSSSKSNVYGWLAQQTRLREWIGAREDTDLSEHVKELFNKSFERMISIDRDQIEDNVLWDYTAMVFPQLGEAARRHPDQLIFDLITANPTTWDGKALFADDHPNFNLTGSGATTYDNNFGLTLTADNLNTARSTMRGYLGEDGYPLGVNPNVLLVPPVLYKPALEITEAENIAQIVRNQAATDNVAASAPTNVMRRMGIQVIEWDFLTNATTWYLLDTRRPIKPFMYQVRRPLQFVAMTRADDEKVFLEKKYRWGVDYRCAVGETLPWLIAKSVG